MKKHLQRSTVFAIAALSVIGLTSCAGDPAPSQTLAEADSALGSTEVAQKMDALYKAAQKGGETSVVVYGPGEQLYGEAYKTFMQRYPDIQVTGEYIYGAELSTRLDQEFSSGQHVGSIQTGGPAMTSASAAAGRCAATKPFAAADIADQLAGADDGTYTAVVGYPFGIAFNTDRISESDLPRRFQDITDPSFKGQFVLEDPTTTNGTTNTMSQMYFTAGTIDDQWLSALSANEPMIRANSALTVQAVASGEAAFDPFAQYVMYKSSIDDGLPVGFYFPTEGSRIEYHFSCILNDAPNPDATELLYNWLFTPEGQDALSSTGVYGVRPGTPAPGDLPDFETATANAMPTTTVDEAGPTTKKFVDISKAVFQ